MAAGKKTGGRQKGTPNKRTAEFAARTEEAARRIEEALPNAFRGDAHALLCAVYKDTSQPLKFRLEAAKAAISFEKPSLGAVKHSGDPESPLALAIMSGVPDANADDHDQRPAAQSH